MCLPRNDKHGFASSPKTLAVGALVRPRPGTARDTVTKQSKTPRGCSQSKASVCNNISTLTGSVGANSMAAKFAPARGEALRHALRASPFVTLPGFLVPAWQGFTRRQPRHFSTTTRQHSKLGQTPISIPPGVELTMGDPKALRSMTSYRAAVKKTITVKGPLGELGPLVPLQPENGPLDRQGG